MARTPRPRKVTIQMPDEPYLRLMDIAAILNRDLAEQDADYRFSVEDIARRCFDTGLSAFSEEVAVAQRAKEQRARGEKRG